MNRKSFVLVGLLAVAAFLTAPTAAAEAADLASTSNEDTGLAELLKCATEVKVERRHIATVQVGSYWVSLYQPYVRACLLSA